MVVIFKIRMIKIEIQKANTYFFPTHRTHSPPHVVISPMNFTPNSDPTYDFQVTPYIQKLVTFNVKGLASFEDATLHSEQYLRLLLVHPKFNILRDPWWINGVWPQWRTHHPL